MKNAPLLSREQIFRQIGYQPSAGQRLFHEAGDDPEVRFRTLIAASRYGKSIAAAYDTLTTLFTPGGRVWIVAPHYELGEFEYRYIREAMAKILGGMNKRHGITSFANSPRNGVMVIETEWNSFVRVKSAKHPQSLLGEEIDLALLAEGSRMASSVFTGYIQARLAMRMGGATLPTTPAAEGFNQWVKQWYARGQDADFPEYRSFGPFAALENPFYPATAFAQAYRTTPWERFREQFLGEFVLPTGRVYNTAEPEAVAITSGEASDLWNWRGWPCWFGVDFGGTNPTAALQVFSGPDDMWYVHDEHYVAPGNAMLLRDHARAIRKMGENHFPRAIWADHDAADQKELVHEFRRHRWGVPVKNARKADLLGGIEILRALFHRGLIRINRERCPNLMRELVEYRWEDSAAENEKNERIFPRDWQNHCLDSLRYAIVSTRKYTGVVLDPQPIIPRAEAPSVGPGQCDVCGGAGFTDAGRPCPACGDDDRGGSPVEDDAKRRESLLDAIRSHGSTRASRDREESVRGTL